MRRNRHPCMLEFSAWTLELVWWNGAGSRINHLACQGNPRCTLVSPCARRLTRAPLRDHCMTPSAVRRGLLVPASDVTCKAPKELSCHVSGFQSVQLPLSSGPGLIDCAVAAQVIRPPQAASAETAARLRPKDSLDFWSTATL